MLYTEEAIKNRKEKIYKMKKKLKLLIYITLIPLLIYNVSLIVQAIMIPNKTPSFLGIKTYVIISGSMMPELNIGDIVVVKDVKDKLEEGDIISFRKGQTIVTHRISKVVFNGENTEYRTKGDNNNVEDHENVTVDKIEGKVIRKIPMLGNISLLLRKRSVIITIILILYIYIIHIQKVQRRKDIRNIKRRDYESKAERK